jgi:hypothetical protein
MVIKIILFDKNLLAIGIIFKNIASKSCHQNNVSEDIGIILKIISVHHLVHDPDQFYLSLGSSRDVNTFINAESKSLPIGRYCNLTILFPAINLPSEFICHLLHAR